MTTEQTLAEYGISKDISFAQNNYSILFGYQNRLAAGAKAFF